MKYQRINNKVKKEMVLTAKTKCRLSDFSTDVTD